MPKKSIPAPKRRARSAAPPPDSKGFSDSALTILAQTMGGGQSIADYLRISLNPLDSFADYEAMNAYPIISRALDVIANEATQPDSEHDNHVAWVVAEESAVQDSLNAVLHQVVKVDHYSWARMRKLAQFGNHFMEPIFGPDGLSSVVDLPIETMRRVERVTGGVHGWVQEFHREPRPWTPETYDVLVAEYQQAQKDPTKRAVRAIPFDPLQVVHMRLLGESLGGLYGDSVLAGARWIWRRLLLMDDAAMIFRLHRAPERFAFYLSLGGKSDEEADAMLRKFRDQIRKRKFVDTSGKQRYRYDPVGVDEDFFVGLRNGDESRIETLTSPTWQCLAGETPIPLLDGTTPTIRELAERGGDFTVYSCDATGRIVPGRGHSARVTHEAAPILEVVLDSGAVVRCTGNHPFLTRSGQWVLAENLTPNTALMPLYRRTSSRAAGDYLTGYEQVYHPATGKYELTHHAVYRATVGPPETVWARGEVIHHRDHRKGNNDQRNLGAVSRKGHAQHHRENVVRLHTPEVKLRARLARCRPDAIVRSRVTWTFRSRRAQHSALMRRRMADPALRAQKSQALAAYNRGAAHRARMTGASNPRYVELTVAEMGREVQALRVRSLAAYRVSGHRSVSLVRRVLRAEGLTWNDFARKYIPGWEPKGRAVATDKAAGRYMNHTVVEVRRTGLFERVYDLTVDEHHNFAVGQGVIVHNSMDDVEAFRTLLFGGLGVPRAYMGDEAGVVRATLSAQDVNFARGELRLQMAYRMGLMEFTDLHIARCGIEPEEVPYEIYMAPPSAIFELAQMEVRNARAGLAVQVQDFFPKPYILQHVFGLAKDEADALSEGKKGEDMAMMTAMQAAETGGEPSGDGAPLGPVAASQAKLSAAAESRRARLLDQKLDRVLAENKPLREELMRIRPMMKTLASLAKVAAQPVRGGPPPRRKSKG